MSEPLEPRTADVPLPEGLPIDAVDVREGPEINPKCLALLPLIGVWRGEGQGDYPTIEGFHYGQEITFFHDGRPFVGMTTRSWILDSEGNYVRPAAREMAWWRPTDGDDFEVIMALQSGIIAVYVGLARTTTSWELTSDLVARTATAKEVTAEKRLYGIVEGELMYAIDMAAEGQPLQPHLSARLARVR
ncbi:FABP family protein [Epidermidibacterium keratini]|uniref:Peroxynitrite isomerase n=1 Tax=Epidermidibacterium keratini TaxID=1891644 RepID=A0A7L4YL34_9ACTN|nr:FABP family protein [Epidermidibacterium keratini]QHB99839.1 FABP family protein [Epidermidibacterium keratini]